MNRAFQVSLNWVYHLKESFLLLVTVIPIGPTTRQFSNKAGPGIGEDWLFPLLPGKSFRNGKSPTSQPPTISKTVGIL